MFSNLSATFCDARHREVRWGHLRSRQRGHGFLDELIHDVSDRRGGGGAHRGEVHRLLAIARRCGYHRCDCVEIARQRL